MHIKEAMKTKVRAIAPETRFREILNIHDTEEVHRIYVTDSRGKLLGVITSYDILKLLVPEYLGASVARGIVEDGRSFVENAFERYKERTARELMTTPVLSIGPDDPLLAAQTLLRDKNVYALAVVAPDGELLGEVTRMDVLRRLHRAFGFGGDTT
ncbi:MAG: CBS domain-containing protein [Thermodesulfobacteriota bacterium]